MDKGRPALTFMFLPGDYFSEIMQAPFAQAATLYSEHVTFIRINCANHATYCRRRGLSQLPTLEFYLPSQGGKSFEDTMRRRLLRENTKFAICPYKSDFSVEGIKTALEAMELLPVASPYGKLQEKLYETVVERL
mmetsp:Transcript_26250/g.46938  ORF Transcript_26250/g.46938 Transcript_26250/m.46938 type:complete len:135 (+) Transcript_26250:818-1222(+)